MIVSPIIPIWIMILICIVFIIIIIKNKKKLVTRILIIVLLFVVNLRLMVPSPNGEKVERNLDVLFVIDNTISMLAEDYGKNVPRLTAVKKDCSHIVNELSGSRFSVITFNDTSQILIPYTKDANMVVDAIDALQVPDSYYAKGSTLNIALKDMERVLKSSNEKAERTRIIFFISDGEITSDEKLKTFSTLKKYITNGAVLGYGTTKGGYMKIKDKYEDNEEYLEDRTSNDYPYPKAISKIEEGNLKSVASDMGVNYINMSKQSNIDSKLREIKRLANNQGMAEVKSSTFTDIYYIFVIPLLLLLVCEFINYKRKI